ncbi:hypothetical protein NE686_17635 [Tissierella carlieri]|uniref:Uncharacterized protein n=1 Tax=Tissierella carlieri TaxID=689904 RepID=A0ABT1SEL7_9FIRM|nr:hypothetical protein [Tissierella carlieri]MCQ4924928.1 hypothetical protein [Tissierella carlieri]
MEDLFEELLKDMGIDTNSPSEAHYLGSYDAIIQAVKKTIETATPHKIIDKYDNNRVVKEYSLSEAKLVVEPHAESHMAYWGDVAYQEDKKLNLKYGRIYVVEKVESE